MYLHLYFIGKQWIPTLNQEINVNNKLHHLQFIPQLTDQILENYEFSGLYKNPSTVHKLLKIKQEKK